MAWIRKLPALLLSGALGVLGVLALYILLLYGVCKPLEDDWITHQVVSQARLVVSALGAADAASRDRVAAELTSRDVMVSHRPPSGEAAALAEVGNEAKAAGRDQLQDLLPELHRALRAALTDPEATIERHVCPEHTCLYVTTRIDGTPWWIGFWLPQRAAYWAFNSTLVIAVLIGLIAWCAVHFSLRRTHRPMLRLVQDLLARRAVLMPIAQPAHGDAELAQVVRSFNEWVYALRRAEQSKRNLMAGVSHDIRTSLARLQLRAEIECADDVYQAMDGDFKAVAHVIDQFLVYAQGHADVIAPSRQQPLAELIQQNTRLYRDPDNVRVTRLDACTFAAPALQVQRVLSNLIDNALAYGQTPVEIELHAAEGGAELLVFDHGKGIAQQDLSQALEPFVRLGEAPSLGPQGHSGLGLAIMAQIAAQLGGRVVMKPFDGQRFGIGIFLPGAANTAEPANTAQMHTAQKTMADLA